jgi:hypothetical protein
VPFRNPFDYVPPEERSGWLRALGFVMAAAMVVFGLALLGLCIYGLVIDRPTYYASLRFAVALPLGGVALWSWLREDPRRR